jgi:endonuclease YncB( thermonuclease family)
LTYPPQVRLDRNLGHGVASPAAREEGREKVSDRSMISRKKIAALLFLASTVAALPGELTGQASIIDGDTLEIHGTRIRLWGIDAPESTQLCRGDDSQQYRCGAKSANDLDAFIAGRPVSCIPISLDQYRRTVAMCSVDGVDLGEWLVSNGTGRNIPKASTLPPSATPSKQGAGSYVEPWLYRACIRANGRPAACSDDANAHPR